MNNVLNVSVARRDSCGRNMEVGTIIIVDMDFGFTNFAGCFGKNYTLFYPFFI